MKRHRLAENQISRNLILPFAVSFFRKPQFLHSASQRRRLHPKQRGGTVSAVDLPLSLRQDTTDMPALHFL